MSDEDIYPSDLMMPDNAPGAPDYTETGDIGRMHAAIAREKMEPRDGMQPMPLWLVGVCGVILFFSGVYLAAYSGGFKATIYDAAAFGGGTSSGPGAANAGGGSAAAADDPVKLGQRFYSQNCAQCHQATGQGVAGQYPPLAGSEWVNGSPRRMAAIILRGVQGPLHVNGVVYNNQMVAWAPTLNDKRIAYIMTYVRQSWGNNASAVTPELVAEVRKATESKTTPYSEAELRAIPE
jgi:mono/diheme cytochrome c family protein